MQLSAPEGNAAQIAESSSARGSQDAMAARWRPRAPSLVVSDPGATASPSQHYRRRAKAPQDTEIELALDTIVSQRLWAYAQPTQVARVAISSSQQSDCG
jgi:hypothetical protein